MLAFKLIRCNLWHVGQGGVMTAQILSAISNDADLARRFAGSEQISSVESGLRTLLHWTVILAVWAAATIYPSFWSTAGAFLVIGVNLCALNTMTACTNWDTRDDPASS